MNKYLITAATALALGITGTLVGGGIVAQAGVTQAHGQSVTLELGAGAITSIRGFVDAQVCPQLNTDLALTGDDECDAATHAKQMVVSFRPNGKVYAQVHFELLGTWMPGAGQ